MKEERPKFDERLLYLQQRALLSPTSWKDDAAISRSLQSIISRDLHMAEKQDWRHRLF